MTYNPERGNVDFNWSDPRRPSDAAAECPLVALPQSRTGVVDYHADPQSFDSGVYNIENNFLCSFAQVYQRIDESIQANASTGRNISIQMVGEFAALTDDALHNVERTVRANYQAAPYGEVRSSSTAEEEEPSAGLWEDGGELPTPASTVLQDILEEVDAGRGSYAVSSSLSDSAPHRLYRHRLNFLKERELWELLWTHLEDEDNAAQRYYDPEVLGLFRIPPHRRWYTSQYAYLQDFLFRSPFFRKATLIVRWLEKVFREKQRLDEDQEGLAYIQDENLHRKRRVRGTDELSLRQLILSRIRGGELREAVKDAFVNEHCPYCCLLSAAQLQTVPEPWWENTTALREVPLFGEYTSSDLSEQYRWVGNECRLETLGLLYEASVREDRGVRALTTTTEPRPTTEASESLDATVAAVLCGNWGALCRNKTFASHWTDVAWAYLRCSLVIAFTHYLKSCQIPVPQDYADYVARIVQDTPHAWVEHYAATVLKGITTLLEPYLHTTPLVDQMQIRVLLQMLQPGRMWFNVRPSAKDRLGQETRLITHVLLVLDQAGREGLAGERALCTTTDDLNYSVRCYAHRLAELYRHHVHRGMELTILLARQLHDRIGRAQAYATYIVWVRRYEHTRKVLNREQIEIQEGRLVRQFMDVDPASHEVGQTVQSLLCDTVPTDTLLTKNAVAERILWEAMHANSDADYSAVLAHGVDACIEFWLDPTAPLLGAIQDVSGILKRNVLLRYSDPSRKEEGKTAEYGVLDPQQCQEASFWYTFSTACRLAEKHMEVCTEMSALRAHVTASATPSSDRAQLYELTRSELSLLSGLASHVLRAIPLARPVVHRQPRCATVILHLLYLFLESALFTLQTRRLEDPNDSTVLHSAALCVQAVYKEEVYLQGKPFVEDRRERLRREHSDLARESFPVKDVWFYAIDDGEERRGGLLPAEKVQPVLRLFAQLQLAVLERTHRRSVRHTLEERTPL